MRDTRARMGALALVILYITTPALAAGPNASPQAALSAAAQEVETAQQQVETAARITPNDTAEQQIVASRSALERANTSLAQARAATARGNNTTAIREAWRARQAANAASRNISDVAREQATDTLHEVRTRLERVNASIAAVNTIERQLNRLNGSISPAELAQAQQEFAKALNRSHAAEQALERNQSVDAAVQAQVALNRSAAAEQALEQVKERVRANVTARLEARIATLEARLNTTRSRSGGQDSEQVEEAEASLKEAKQEKKAVQNASTLEEMADQTTAAESSLDVASERIAAAESAAAAVQYGLFGNLALVAALIALLTGSGFLYYKMTWTEDRWKDDDDGGDD